MPSIRKSDQPNSTMGDKNDRIKRANTRISAACSPCRAKKQKCSGEKPKCEQCQAAGRDCEWPKQIKRGPSKDYIRILESRLRQTEEILLRILPLVSDDQLSSVLADGTLLSTNQFYPTSNPMSAHGDRENSPLNHLRSPEELRSWYLQRKTRDTGRLDRPTSASGASSQRLRSRQRVDSYSDSDHTQSVDEEPLPVEVPPPSASQHYMPYTTRMGTMSIAAYMPNAYANLPTPAAFETPAAAQESNGRAMNESESLLLSPSFQEEFVW